MKNILIISVVFLLTNSTIAQNIEKDNVQLINQIPVEKCRSVFVRNSIAFIGTDTLFIIMDLTDPLQPQTLGSCSVPSTATEIILKDSIAFVLTNETGLRILNISDYQNPNEINFYRAGFDTVYFLDIFIQDTLAIIADREYGVRIVSIFDIYNIYQLSLFNNASFPVFAPTRYPSAVSMKGNYCYIGLFTFDLDPNSNLWVLDITDPGNPILDPNGSWLGEGIEFMDIDSTYLFICEYEFSFYIFDISIPDTFIQISNLDLGWSHYYGGLMVTGDFAYVSDLYQAEIVDISDISNPILTGDYPIIPLAYSIFSDQNYIYVCSYSGYLYVLQFIDPNNIENDIDSYPQHFYLKQNYPNPFNPTTTIEYFLPKQGQVELILYDVSGQEIQMLYSGIKSTGNHKYIFDGSHLASGIYFIKMQAGDYTSKQKILLVK